MISKIEMQAMDAVIGIHREMRKANEIDWEQRRYEIAKSMLPVVRSNSSGIMSIKQVARLAVDYADALIEELKGGNRETEEDEWRQKLREELRRKRSVCLKLMQQLGIDTTDWNRVNEFCNNPRIAGKPFVQVSTAELEQLAIKLRAIQRKGGLTDK